MILKSSFKRCNSSQCQPGCLGASHSTEWWILEKRPSRQCMGRPHLVPGIYDRAKDSVTTYRKLEAVSVVDTKARACFYLVNALFNKSLNLQQVPLEWKHAVVIPIYKGGRKDRQNPTSYRPISLTSCVARLMEKLLNTQILRYLQSHSLIFQHRDQSGFLPNHLHRHTTLLPRTEVANGYWQGWACTGCFPGPQQSISMVELASQAWSENCQHLDFRVPHSPG